MRIAAYVEGERHPYNPHAALALRVRIDALVCYAKVTALIIRGVNRGTRRLEIPERRTLHP